MNPLVIDASVAFKWVVDEAYTEQARTLLADAISGGVPLLGPPHLPSEVANALYRCGLRTGPNAISSQDAEAALTDFLSFPIRLADPHPLYLDAFHFAQAHQLSSLYDAAYVVLAQAVGVELWTDDQRLLQSLGANAPWVRWIGDYPLTSAGGSSR